MSANITFVKYGRVVGLQVPPLPYMDDYATEDVASGEVSVGAATNERQVVIVKAIGSDMRLVFGEAPTPSPSAGVYISDGEVREFVLPVGYKVAAEDAA